MMELLAPAGSPESLRAAVQNGADAVYLGGSLFNARRYASNFDAVGLQSAFDYCHVRGVRVYVTLNTLLFDKEMQPALDYAASLYRMGADAVLVQDLGLCALLRRQLPALALHASTQMAIHDLAGVRMCGEMGLTRVVLARETSMRTLAYIHGQTDVELEVFVQGAMCMSVSGNCLFSSMAGERSGNRGTCAQPCRKPCSVSGNAGTDYHLSLSDLCMLEHVPALAAAGAASLKIEGRMKRPEYVAAAVRAYRAALSGADAQTLAKYKKELCAVFDRDARTGYFFGDGAVTGCVAKSDPPPQLLAQLRASYAGEQRKRDVDMALALRAETPAALTLNCAGSEVCVTGATPQAAQKPQSAARYAEQLGKLGDTPFRLADCTVAGTGLFLSASDLNALRRAGCTALQAQLCPRRTCAAPTLPPVEFHAPAGRIAAKVRSLAQLKAALDAGADLALFEPVCYAMDPAPLFPYRERLLLSLPAVTGEAERETVRSLLQSGCFIGAQANNIGQWALLGAFSERWAGPSLNVLNRYAAQALYARGFTRVVLSLELTRPQARDILRAAGGTVCVYGRAPLMQLRHCPVREHKGCRGCQGDAGTLTDAEGRAFPLCNIRQQEGCLVRVLNCAATDVIDLMAQQAQCDWLLDFYTESAAAVAERVDAARRARCGETVARVGETRGHWNREVE